MESAVAIFGFGGSGLNKNKTTFSC